MSDVGKYKSVQVYLSTWEMLTRIIQQTGATRNRLLHRLVQQEYARVFGVEGTEKKGETR